MARSSTHDITKLPLWAQNKIQVLQNRLDSANAKLAAGPEDSNAFANPYSDAPQPLGKDPNIVFQIPNPRSPDAHPWQFRVTLEDDQLYVNASGSGEMVVLPRASNAFYVRMQER